jgi:uncharacterized membrane protein (UPF0127 family)
MIAMQKMAIKLRMMFLVATNRIRNANAIAMRVPWTAPVMKAYSDGIH